MKKERFLSILKTYWPIPAFIIVISGYIYMKYNSQKDFRERGKCTTGIVTGGGRFTSKHYRTAIEYTVDNVKYVLITPESMITGSKVNIVYDSINPGRSSMVDTCVEAERENIKIDFW